MVAGGGLAGVCAAIAAAREGASVILLEPTGHVGGVNTGGASTGAGSTMSQWSQLASELEAQPNTQAGK